MPSLKDIRRRIASVKNTQKVTKSMKMVSGAKLRRAEEAASRSRPYAGRLDATIRQLVGGLDETAHPLLAPREAKSIEWIVVTSDRGLCGGLNSQLLRRAEREMRALRATGATVRAYVVGRKAREYFRRRGWDLTGEATGFSAAPTAGQAAEVARAAMERFRDGTVDQVLLTFSEYVSPLVQRPVVQQLLPIVAAEGGEEAPAAGAEPIFEPQRTELLAVLLPLLVESRVYRGFLENAASEHAARMAAMESATKNAGEMIGSLTLQFNKARQAAITKELMEIVGGAEALASG